MNRSRVKQNCERLEYVISLLEEADGKDLSQKEQDELINRIYNNVTDVHKYLSHYC